MTTADHRATVLIFVQLSTHFQEQIRVAELLRTSDRYRPVLLIMAPYPGHAAHLRRCADRQIESIGPDDLARYLPPLALRGRGPARLERALAVATRSRLRQVRVRVGVAGRAARAARVAAWLTTVALGPVLRPAVLAAFGFIYRCAPDRLPPEMQAQHYVWRLAPSLVRALDVRVLVIPEDNFYYFTNLFVDAVRRHGGRSLIVPFTIVNTREWLEAFYRLPSHDARAPVNALAVALFPAWAQRYKARDLTMPAQHVLSNEYLHVAPPIPWLINSGHADALAVESPFMERYYLQAGLERARLRLVGSLADDVLFAQRGDADRVRARLCRELRLPAGRELVLCALPPNQLAGDGRPDCEAESYEAVIDAFLRPLERLRATHNVVVSLHPRITAAEAGIVRRYHLAVSSWNIAELVPLAGLYVASCSATIRLAISCGIPTLNYDIYRYDYGDYDDVPGVVTLDSHARYARAVERMVPGGVGYETERARAAAFAASEMHVDGRAGERLLALFDELLEP